MMYLLSDESLVISGEPVLPQQQRVWLETRLAPRLAAWLTDNLTNSQVQRHPLPFFDPLYKPLSNAISNSLASVVC